MSEEADFDDDEDPEESETPFRPSLQAWAGELDRLGHLFLEQVDPAGKQQVAALLINAVSSMLRHDALGERVPNATKALGQIMCAFLDQSEGVPSALLKPKKRASPGRPKESHVKRLQQASVAACVELLCRNGMPVGQAAHEVALIWTRAGLKISKTTAFNLHAIHWPSRKKFQHGILFEPIPNPQYVTSILALERIRGRFQISGQCTPKSLLLEAIREEATSSG